MNKDKTVLSGKKLRFHGASGGATNAVLNAAKRGEFHELSMDDEIRWSCNAAGRCCLNTEVLVTPADIWRIAKNGEIVKALGVGEMIDLFTIPVSKKRGLFMYTLGARSCLPIAMIEQVKIGEVNDCVFSAPVLLKKDDETNEDALKRFISGDRSHIFWNEDGTPRRGCAIQDVKPTVCRAYPLGRTSAFSMGMKLTGKTKFIWSGHECVRCNKKVLECEPMKVSEYAEKNDLANRYRQSDLYHKMLEKFAQIESERLRFIIGLMMFDPRSMEKFAPVAFKKPAPSTFEEHMDLVSELCDFATCTPRERPDRLAKMLSWTGV